MEEPRAIRQFSPTYQLREVTDVEVNEPTNQTSRAGVPQDTFSVLLKISSTSSDLNLFNSSFLLISRFPLAISSSRDPQNLLTNYSTTPHELLIPLPCVSFLRRLLLTNTWRTLVEPFCLPSLSSSSVFLIHSSSLSPHSPRCCCCCFRFITMTHKCIFFFHQNVNLLWVEWRDTGRKCSCLPPHTITLWQHPRSNQLSTT